MSKLDTYEVMKGAHDGAEVWVCSYNQPDLNKKPLRNVPPTKCLIQPISETSKTVYYTESFFAPLSASGKPLKKVISPVDNTGFRTRCGNIIDVFDSEIECLKCWNNQIDEHLEGIQIKIDNAAARWQDDFDELSAKRVFK